MKKSYVLKTIIARLLIACVVFVLAGGSLSAQQIKPHAAIYEVRLGRATGPEGPAGLGGTMVYVVEDVCDGFEQSSSLDVSILDRQGRESDLRQTFTSFETKDGTRSNFEMQIISSGRVVDEYKGRVEIDENGGRMIYDRETDVGSEENDTSYDLKPGAQLSLNYTAEVVDSALKGTPFISRVVADGLLEDGPSRISAVVGKRDTKKQDINDPDGLLTGAAWPVQLAYYPTSSSDELPSQEMRVELYEGGIVGKIDQNMGGYSVLTTLIDLQAAKSCQD